MIPYEELVAALERRRQGAHTESDDEPVAAEPAGVTEEVVDVGATEIGGEPYSPDGPPPPPGAPPASDIELGDIFSEEKET